MFELFALVMLIVIATLLAWLSLRAWRTGNGLIKWAITSLAALSSAAVTLICLFVIVGLFKLHSRSALAPVAEIAGTSEQVQRGKAISEGFCSGCHSATGTLAGGLDIAGHLPMPIGSFMSSNLTPGGRVRRGALTSATGVTTRMKNAIRS